MLHLIDTQKLLVSDLFKWGEGNFFINGSINRHNCLYWFDQHPDWFEEIYTQHPQKLNMGM